MLLRRSWPCLLLVLTNSLAQVAHYVPAAVNVGVGTDGGTASLELMVPSSGSTAIGDPATLFNHVKGAWDSVVENNQAGLTPPDTKGLARPSPPLSPREAWHHFQASQNGVVDSARFLIAFSLVPSVTTGGTPLHVAAALGDVAGVERLLASPELLDVDAEKESDGTTALHSAVVMGHTKIVSLLLAAGAHVDHAAKSGATPLMTAAAMGHNETAAVLLEEGGADVDAQHAFAKNTALHFAAEVGRVEVIRLLCARGADVGARKSTGGTSLHTAADCNQTGAVEALIACGADVNDSKMNGDTTPLYLSAQRGFAQVMRVLIAAGADVDHAMPVGTFQKHLMLAGQQNAGPGAGQFYGAKNLEVGNGATALHCATENGHTEAVRVLLDAGAKQSTAMEGASPLLLALQYRHPHIALLLLSYDDISPGGGARVNAATPKDGATPLLSAVHAGYDDVVVALLARGANARKADRRGMRPLVLAVRTGRVQTLKHLLGHKTCGPWARTRTSDAGARQRHGTKKWYAEAGEILSAAIGTGSVRTLQMLLTHAAAVVKPAAAAPKVVDSPSPIHVAARRGATSMLQMLLKHRGRGLGIGRLDGKVRGTGASILHFAAQASTAESSAAVLQVLLNLRPQLDVDARAGSEKMYGATPLLLAAQAGHLEPTRLLLDARASSTIRLERINTGPVFVAAAQGHVEVLRLLLDRFSDSESSPSHSHDTNIDLKQELEAPNWNGITALFVSALAHKPESVKLLHQRGAELQTLRQPTDNSTLLTALAAGLGTPTRFALGREARETIRYVLKETVAGAEAGHDTAGLDARRSSDGATALLALVQAATGTTDDAADGDGAGESRPAIKAFRSEKDERDLLRLVRAFLAAGADINARTAQGRSSLAAAVVGGHPGLVKLLLAATPTPRSEGGEKPRTCDDENGSSCHASSAIDINIRQLPGDGKTPLQLAVELYCAAKKAGDDGRAGQQEESTRRDGILKILLGARASVDDETIDVARQARDAELLKLLVDAAAQGGTVVDS